MDAEPGKEARKRESPALPEWVPKAWEMRVVQMKSWEDIASEVGCHWETAKKWVTAYSKILGEVADDEDPIHARAELIASMQGIKRQTQEIVTGGGRDADKVAALNTNLKACEKLAVAKGIATEKKDHRHGGLPGAPPVALIPVFAENDPLNHVEEEDGGDTDDVADDDTTD